VPIENESFVIFEGGWTVRVQPALSNPPTSVITFLHGWTGNENSMGIFSRGLESAWKFYPRGPIRLGNGFAWIDDQSVTSVRLSSFEPVSQTLFDGITNWIDTHKLNGLPVYLVGFSQGAAMALSLTLRYPLFQRTAILSGFLPDGGESFLLGKSLSGKVFLIAHGRLDELVPVDLARKTFQILENAGASVDYCEEDVGHKLSKSCFDRLKVFLSC